VARKQPPDKPGLEDSIALLRQRYGGRLAPPLEGLAYRFTVWLPVQSHGKPVFSGVHRILLNDFFHDCFGGYSQSSLEGFPPWSGSWLPPGTDQAIVDHHILLIVYTLQDAEALVCMRQLKWVLQQDEAAAQQVVLVEQVPVHLIEATELT
jgi:hypothetical protein